MTHNAAVETIVKLASAIAERGAHATLLEHAERESMSPAQLEKLGQLVNTTAVISYIDRAADRGASFPLLDVPALVTDYVQSEKAAGRATLAPYDEGDDWTSVDLGSALRADLAPRREKAAAAVAPASDAPREVAFEDLTREQQKEAAVAVYADNALRMEEIFKTFKKKAAHDCLDLTRASRNARYLCKTAWIKDAAEWLETHLKRDVLIDEQPLVKRAFEVRDPDADLLVELADAVRIHRLLRKEAVGGSLLDDPDPAAKREPTLKSPPGGGSGKGGLTLDEMFALENHKAELRQRERAAENKTDTDYDAKMRPEPYEHPDLDRIDAVLAGAGATAKETGKSLADMVGGAAETADEKLKDLLAPRTNKPQMELDNEVSDIQRSMRVRRMIATDPILREANQKKVLDIYNSVVSLNPEIADNVPALTLILREAASYDGLTLDSQKLLTDVRKNMAQSRATEKDNDKRKYEVGRESDSKSKRKA